MYGWRSKIGIIIPSANNTMEPEMWLMAPEGVSIHSSRMLATGCSIDDLKSQDVYVEGCAVELGTAFLDLIIFGCTSGSFLGGIEWEKDICERIEKASNCRAITTIGAVLNALEFLGKKKLTIVSPYVDEVATLESQFLTEQGYDVVSERNFGYDKGIDILSLHPEDTYRYARETVLPETEILFLSCTNMRTIENIEILERDLGIPVISSNQCSMWDALRITNTSQNLTRWGSLFYK